MKYNFLGAIVKLRQETIIFVVSVRAPVRIKHLGSRWTDFHEI
jgi:hypothetical protein